jgi:hypothetical protein
MVRITKAGAAAEEVRRSVCLVTDPTDSIGKLLKDAAAKLDSLSVAEDTAATHDVTTVNDTTETQVFEITDTTIYALSVYFDLNALVAAAEGGTVTLRLYNKIDAATYREIAKVEFIVGTERTHPSFEAAMINHNAKVTIQCSTNVTATRTINYRYIKKALE